MFKFYLTNNSEIMFYDTESHLLFTSGLCLVKLKINSGTPTYCVTSILNNFLTCLGKKDGFGLSDESAQYFKNLVQSGSGYLHPLNNCFDEMKIFKEGEYHGINTADSLSTMNSFIDIAALSTIDQKFSTVEQKLNLASTNYLCSNSTPGNTTNKHLEIMSPQNETYIKPNSIIAVLHMYTNTATTPCFYINNQPVPIYYENGIVTTSNLQLAGEENKLYYYYYFKEIVDQSEEELLLYLGKADANSNGGGMGGATTPLKTVRGDYVVIDDNISPYLYDFKLVSRKTESTETAGTLVPLEQVEAGDYTINFVTVGSSKGITTGTAQANSSNSFTFPKIRCGEKWTLKGTISSDYYIAKAIVAKFYDKDEVLISQQDLTYPESAGNSVFANRYYYYIKDIKTPKNCAFVTFSITSRGYLSSGSSSKQYFTLTNLYWQNDYTDIELDNYNTNIKTVPFHVSYSMFGLQKEAEVRTNYWYSDDYGYLINFDSEHDDSCYTHLLGDRSWYTLSEGIFSIDLWKYNYYSYLANAPVLNISNICSNYYLPKNSVSELENKTFCIIPGNSSNNTNYGQASMMLYIKDDSFSSVEDFVNFCKNNNIVVSFKIDSSNLPQQTHYKDWNEGTSSSGGEEIFPEYVQDLNTPLLGNGSLLGDPNSAPHNQRYGKDIFTGQYTLIYVTGPDESDTKPLMEITYYQNPSYTIKDIKNKTDNFVNKTGDTMTGSLFMDAENSNNNIGINIGMDRNKNAGKASLTIGGFDYYDKVWDAPVIATGNNSLAQGENVFAAGASSHAEGIGAWAGEGENGHPLFFSGEANTTTYTANTRQYWDIHLNFFVYCPQTNKFSRIISIENPSSGVYVYTMSSTLNPNGSFDNVPVYQVGGSVAAADGSHIEGYRCNVYDDADYGHAEGYLTNVFNEGGHAEGDETKAGYYAHTEGYYTVAEDYAHAEGFETLAIGTYSHAEGFGDNYNAYYDDKGTGRIVVIDANTNTYQIIKTQKYVDVEPGLLISNIYDMNDFSNNYCTITSVVSPQPADSATFTTDGPLQEGLARLYINGAIANYSHAEGINTTTLGNASHAEGIGTITKQNYQHTEGKYNIADDTSLHIIGNGTSNNARSNAHTLDALGNAWFSGDVYVNSTSGTNKDEGSKKLPADSITNEFIYEITNAVTIHEASIFDQE